MARAVQRAGHQVLCARAEFAPCLRWKSYRSVLECLFSSYFFVVGRLGSSGAAEAWHECTPSNSSDVTPNRRALEAALPHPAPRLEPCIPLTTGD
jgi:hypothetical protein